MADMETALRARLAAAAPIDALIWKSETGVPAIHWVERPQGGGLPAITLQVIPTPRVQSMEGFVGLQSTQVQIDVWAASYGQKKTLAEAVVAAVVPATTINGIRFERAFVERMGDRSATDTRTQGQDGLPFIHRTEIDLIVWHSPA